MITNTERTPEQMAYPYVNLNGSSKEDLIELRLEAYSAVRAAMAAISVLHPNCRDYQTAPRGAYEAALKRYNAQFAPLDKLSNELMDEIQFLQDHQ